MAGNTTDDVGEKMAATENTAAQSNLRKRHLSHQMNTFGIDESRQDELSKLYASFDEAGLLEHVLMLSYLYTAYSIKTRWEEVAYDYDEKNNEWKKNPMADIDFENLREWQGHIVNVAKEEMIHLNYVSVLARAIGRAPNFNISPNYPHFFPNWKPISDAEPVKVEFQPLSYSTIMKFMEFESTVKLVPLLKDKGGIYYGDTINLLKSSERLDLLCKAYYALGEVDENLPEVQKFLNYYRGEKYKQEKSSFSDQVVKIVSKFSKEIEMNKEEFQLKFREIINNSISWSVFLSNSGSSSNIDDCQTESYKSIGQFYKRLEKYFKKAVEKGIITHPDPTSNETKILQNLKLFLLPTARTENLKKTYDSKDDHIRAETFSEIMKIISEEGEGSSNSLEQLKQMCRSRWRKKDIEELLLVNTGIKNKKLEDLEDRKISTARKNSRTVWNSHFTLFTRIFARLCARDAVTPNGVKFSCERVPVTGLPTIITDDIILNINLLYLVTRVWLHRMYLIFDDDPENDSAKNAIAVSSVVAWGLMSQTIRPILEIFSFVPNKDSYLPNLFKIPENLENIDLNNSVESLSTVLVRRETSANFYEIDSIDTHAFNILRHISNWSKDCIGELDKCDTLEWKGVHPEFNPVSFVKGMLFRRFEGLHVCTKELILQIPFRIARGFSGDPSSQDLDDEDVKNGTYAHSENIKFKKYELNKDCDVLLEDGKLPKVAVGVPRGLIFEKGQKILKLQFQGWIINQLATDSDCNMSEVSLNYIYLCNLLINVFFIRLVI